MCTYMSSAVYIAVYGDLQSKKHSLKSLQLLYHMQTHATMYCKYYQLQVLCTLFSPIQAISGTVICIVVSSLFTMCPLLLCCMMSGVYHMGTNFRGWLNFIVFEGTSQTAKIIPAKFFVRLCPRKNTCCHWARQAQEWRSFITFDQPLTAEEKLSVLFSFAITCSLIHEYRRTTNPEKGMVITPITNPRKLKPSKI